jgi:hypothetical protein
MKADLQRESFVSSNAPLQPKEYFLFEDSQASPTYRSDSSNIKININMEHYWKYNYRWKEM